MGFTNAKSKQILDQEFPVSGATSHVAWSTNGTSESSIVARTPVGATGWAAATTADPSVKANSAALTSEPASGAGTISHFAIYSAATGGTQITDWTALADSKALAEDLSRKGHTVIVSRQNEGFRLFVGPFKSTQLAENSLQKIRAYPEHSLYREAVVLKRM